MKRYRSGEQVPKTGTYILYNVNGNVDDTLFLEKGQHFPPTQSFGSFYVISKK